MSDDVMQSTSQSDDAASGGSGEEVGGRTLTLNFAGSDRILLGVGGAAMAVSALLSWVEISGLDSMPNVSGIGATTSGAGLIVFLLGLSLLMRTKAAVKSLGAALGGFSVALIFIVRTGTDDSGLALGAWIGLIGAAVAVLGAGLLALDSANRPAQSVSMIPAALGGALAVVSSFWLNWSLGGSEPLDGLDADIVSGQPILILGVAALALVLIMTLVSGVGQLPAMVCQAGGMVILVLAATDVIGAVMVGGAIASGPLVALIGGVMLSRSVTAADAD